jgi:hypothetical protein
MTANQRLLTDFFNRRDQRSEIILERLESPENAAESMDGRDRRVDFIYKGKSYWCHYGQCMQIQSFEFRPRPNDSRTILGVPYRLSGIDYAYPFFRRRVTWTLWSGTPTQDQTDRIWDIATLKIGPTDPFAEWEHPEN